jgi:hypothetical protein
MTSVDTCLILNLDERVDLWDGLVDFREQWEKSVKSGIEFLVLITEINRTFSMK